jgi:hypothetical protein
MTIPGIARVCHEANRVYCQELGDNSQPPWENAPRWQIESAINGVQFHLDNPNAGPSGSHENWLKVKEAEGWKYGPIKDADKKEHPCFVPYDQLPLEQRLKDSVFTSIVHALAPLVGTPAAT